MDNIKISIILPVFNEEEYIKATLDSIFNQDFDDFDLLKKLMCPASGL